MIKKSSAQYRTIGQVAKDLQLTDKKSGNLKTHTIRFWETQFKQLKPTIRAGNRRYYSQKDFQIIKTIAYMLKDKGLTIRGAKKILNTSNLKHLDDDVDFDVNKLINTDKLKERLQKINKLIRDLKDVKNG